MFSRKCRLLAVLGALSIAGGADWPQWRGPQRDGVVRAGSAPASWPEHLKLRWKTTVGEGHSSPILASGKIYVFSRQQGREVASAIDLQGGKILWQQSYAAPYTMHPAAVRHGQGPKSTLVFADARLYTLGIGGILTCWNAATGSVIWRREFSKLYGTASPDFGTAMSPVVDKGLVIAHIGGHSDGALTGFDAASGEVRWRWTGDGPAYASPILIELDGVRQFVTETQNNVVGVSAANGELLWKIPFTTQYDQNIPTPLVYRDELIISGLAQGIMAVRVTRNQTKWLTETVWHNHDVALYMNSPVAEGHLLFGFSHLQKGQLFCLDLRTGATQWKGPPRQGDNASLLISGEDLVALKDDAELIIAKAGRKAFELTRSYTVADSPTWAHPLMLPDGVVVKDATTLARWSTD